MPTRAQLLQRRALLVAASRARHTARPMPRPVQPTGPTRALTAAMLVVAADLDAEVDAILRDGGLHELRTPRTDAADGDVPPFDRRALGARLNALAQKLIAKRGSMLDTALGKVGAQVATLTKEQWARQAKAVMGVDLSEVEPNLTSTMERLRKEHVGLIRTMAEDKARRVKAILDDAPNARVETLRAHIMEDTGVTKRQAALIARDQVLSLNSEVTQKRHEAAGVTKYIWRTSGDGDVRPAHKALDGKSFSYDDPPVVDRKSGRRARPGEDYQCRCTMEPLIEGFDDDVPAEQTTKQLSPPPRLRYPEPPPPPSEREEDTPERSHRSLSNDRHANFDAMPVEPKLQGVAVQAHKAATVQYPQNHLRDEAFTAHLEEQSRKAAEAIAPAHIAALEAYTGPAYQRANLLLREGPEAVVKRYGKKAMDGLDAIVEGTTRALEQLPRAPSDMVLFRGATFKDLKHLDALASGSEFESKAFLSTSRDPGVALGFGGGYGDDPSVLYRIRKHQSGAILAPAVSDGAEAEVLFPPGTRFRIIGRQRVSATQIVVDMEQIE